MTLHDTDPASLEVYPLDSFLTKLKPEHHRMNEIIQMRRNYAVRNNWIDAIDPDEYDTLGTVTLAASAGPNEPFRTSLRLTHLGHIGNFKRECLSLSMLGSKAQFQESAAARLKQSLSPEDVVYDMTRFVTDESLYSGDIRSVHHAMTTDFLLMIGGAVEATDEEALVENRAVWVFTGGPEMYRLLKRHNILPQILAEGKNDDGAFLQFCMIRPEESLRYVEQTSQTSGSQHPSRKAALNIGIGKSATSV